MKGFLSRIVVLRVFPSLGKRRDSISNDAELFFRHAGVGGNIGDWLSNCVFCKRTFNITDGIFYYLSHIKKSRTSLVT